MLMRSQNKKILVNLEQCIHLKIRAYEKKLNDKGKIIYAYYGLKRIETLWMNY